ncbi:MAG: hypothetical protein Q8P91_02390 [bacterium]|nr:hypothetical protein [bacterium]
MAQNWRKEYLRYKSFFLSISDLYRKKRDLRMYLEILLSLATISFFGVFALRPTLLTISQLVVEIKSKKETIAIMNIKIKNLESAQQILLQETYRLPLLDTSVFDTPKPEVIARQFEGLSNKNIVKISGLSFEKTTLKPLPENSEAINLTVSAAGSYQGLYSFLKDVENLRIPVQIDTFQIGTAKAEDKTFLTLAISGRIPYLGNHEKK